jgi:hypothetical protein
VRAKTTAKRRAVRAKVRGKVGANVGEQSESKSEGKSESDIACGGGPGLTIFVVPDVISSLLKAFRKM